MLCQATWRSNTGNKLFFYIKFLFPCASRGLCHLLLLVLLFYWCWGLTPALSEWWAHTFTFSYNVLLYRIIRLLFEEKVSPQVNLMQRMNVWISHLEICLGSAWFIDYQGDWDVDTNEETLYSWWYDTAVILGSCSSGMNQHQGIYLGRQESKRVRAGGADQEVGAQRQLTEE